MASGKGFAFTGNIGGMGEERGDDSEASEGEARDLRRPDFRGALFLGGLTGEEDSAPDWKILLSSQPLSSVPGPNLIHRVSQKLVREKYKLIPPFEKLVLRMT